MLSTLRLLAILIACAAITPNPLHAEEGDIVFVTQVPHANPDGAIDSGIVTCFHPSSTTASLAPRGGDLYIRYADGTLRNITKLAGYGNDNPAADGAIAVRDPHVHWSGHKVIFSMLVSGANRNNSKLDNAGRINASPDESIWQLYVASQLAKDQTPVITKLSNQPRFNNVMPAYGSDNSIFFISDIPRDCRQDFYPKIGQSDPYLATVNSGLYRLSPDGQTIRYLDHQPSGAFDPQIDSFGRVILNHWDLHQAYSGRFDLSPRDFSSEDLGQIAGPAQSELLHQLESTDHTLPWTMNQDGTELVTLAHLGRHDLSTFTAPISVLADPSLSWDAPAGTKGSTAMTIREGMSQIAEDPQIPGRYFAINQRAFQGHCAGQIVEFRANPEIMANQVQILEITDPLSASTFSIPNSDAPTPIPGRFRDPVMLRDGTLIAAHNSNLLLDHAGLAVSAFDFRLKRVERNGAYHWATTPLTSGIIKPSAWSGPLWELQPVELSARPIPPFTTGSALETPEASVFSEEGIEESKFRAFLKAKNTALMVSRNVTARDAADQTQPFNLRVDKPGGAITLGLPVNGATPSVYSLSFLEILQADSLRQFAFTAGRRDLARRLHQTTQLNPASPAGDGMVEIEADGSVAAIVPAERALTWRTTQGSSAGFEPVVRELYWLTFQPGEIRVCASCHFVNERDQAGRPLPQNKPEALRKLLRFYKDQFASTPSSAPAPSSVSCALATPQQSPSPPASIENLIAQVKLLSKQAAALPSGNHKNKLQKKKRQLALKARKLLPNVLEELHSTLSTNPSLQEQGNLALVDAALNLAKAKQWKPLKKKLRQL